MTAHNETMAAVMAKIRKLLARGDEARNDNEHERAIAMRQASALMARHGLEMSELADAPEADTFGALGQLPVDVDSSMWVGAVYWTIAELHGCTAFRRSGRGYGTKMVIIGRAMRATVAKAMAAYVVASIKREATRQYALADGWTAARTFHANFGQGAASGVRKQVRELLAAQATGDLGDVQVSASQALVVVSQHKASLAEADAHMRANNKISAGRATRMGGVGYGEGRAYGTGLSLNAQIGGGARRALK